MESNRNLEFCDLKATSTMALQIAQVLLEAEHDPFHPITLRNQRASPLLRLPAELRNRIFGYVFDDITWHIGYERPRVRPVASRKFDLGLLLACRQTRSNACLLPWSQCSFNFAASYDWKVFLDKHGNTSQQSAITSIIMRHSRVESLKTDLPLLCRGLKRFDFTALCGLSHLDGQMRRVCNDLVKFLKSRYPRCEVNVSTEYDHCRLEDFWWGLNTSMMMNGFEV